MAIKGVSKLVVGNYDYDGIGNVPTYSDNETVAKMVEYALTINQSDNNPLYADNMEAENDKGTFQNGELSLTTDDLTQEASKKILGIKTNEFSYGDSLTATEGVYDDSRIAPYLGVGIIEMHQNNDVTKYRAVFLPKVFFNVPEQAATTKGENIEWQTPTVTGIVQRSDLVQGEYNHPWMIDAWFETESQALSYLEYKCGKGAKKKVNKVTVSGTPQVNSTLTAMVEPAEATVTYQWKQSDSSGGSYSDISGANSNTYQLKESELNKFIKVEVTGTSEYEGIALSPATTQVQGAE